MGKALDLPVHKLLGQKKRNVIPVAAWTRPAAPEIFRDEIKRAAEEGYRVYKIHTCTYHDVFEQTRLAEEVAPESFRIHYDFNHNRSLGSSLPIIKELERNHPIVGYIEDPLDKKDIDGWQRLRQQTDLPLIMHGTPLGGIQELIYGLADMYMIGGSLEDTMAAGWACGKANVQVLLQFEGGTLGKAMAMHMASVLPPHTARKASTAAFAPRSGKTMALPNLRPPTTAYKKKASSAPIETGTQYEQTASVARRRPDAGIYPQRLYHTADRPVRRIPLRPPPAHRRGLYHRGQSRQ